MAKNYRAPGLTPTPDALGAGSYDKILAIYHNSSGNMVVDRQNKATIGFKTGLGYEAIINDFAESGMYQRVAGLDLGGLLFPFETRYNSNSGNMPCFYYDASGALQTNTSGVYISQSKLLPFTFNKQDSSYLYYTPNIASGLDGIKGV